MITCPNCGWTRKPCPFCGSPHVELRSEPLEAVQPDQPHMMYVVCQACKSRGSWYWHADEGLAAKVAWENWNHRASDA